MNTPHIIALILAGLGLLLLLIQTARAAYWRGAHIEVERRCNSHDEEIIETRRQRDAARKDAEDAQLYTRAICDRLMIAAHQPEAYDELIKANDVLRSLYAVVERQGTDTNWESLEARLSERLKAQHRLMHTPED